MSIFKHVSTTRKYGLLQELQMIITIPRKAKIPIDNLKFLRNADVIFENKSSSAKMIDFVEHQYDKINLTKSECALIQITTSPQGTQTFDLPQNLKRQNRPR